MGIGIDRLTWIVMIVLVVAAIEVMAPGTIEGVIRLVTRQLGLS